MNNRKKALCFLVLVLVVFGGAFAMNMFSTTPATESLNIGEPVNNYGVAAAAATDAVGPVANNVTNPRGGDDLLAGAYETYTLVVNASDADGFADILNITVAFVASAAPATTIAGFFCDTTGAAVAVSELSTGAAKIRYVSATNVSATNDYDITILFKVEWAMGAQTDLDLNVTVYEAAASASTIKNVNLDVIATLTLSDAILFTYTEYASNEHCGTMSLTYHYTGYTTLYPLGAETDFWVTRSAITSESIGSRSYESSSYTDSTGVAIFSTILAPDVNNIVTDTMTLFAVAQSGGASDTSLMATTNTDTCLVNPSANTDGRTTREDAGTLLPFNSFEGFVLIGAASIIVVGGGIYITRKGSSTGTRRKSTRKRTTRKKSTKRKRRR